MPAMRSTTCHRNTISNIWTFKPGNLLLMADRIKVADFGLIKDLHDPNVLLLAD